MQLLNDTTGYAMVDQRLKWTDDGGKTWRDITPANLKPSDAKFDAGELAYFLDSQTGWMLATRPHDRETPSDLFIWRTTDGGASWQETRLDGPAEDPNIAPPLFGPWALQFVDPEHGWFVLAGASGNFGGVGYYYTSDGGASWSSIPGQNYELHGGNGSWGPMHFANVNDGWEAWEADQTLAKVTHDGGRTWLDVPLEAPDFGKAYGWMWGFSTGTLGSSDGFIPIIQAYREGNGAEKRRVGIFKTNDAGRDWSFAGLAPDDCGLIFFASKDVWIEAARETLYVTEDGGAQWLSRDINWSHYSGANTADHPERIAFADANHGWAVVSDLGVNPVLLATEDGGHTWRIISPK